MNQVYLSNFTSFVVLFWNIIPEKFRNIGCNINDKCEGLSFKQRLINLMLTEKIFYSKPSIFG